MPKHILMPSLAAGMEDGRLVRWLKKPGDHVSKGDVLVEIETDKALLEMEAEDDGTLGAVIVADGTPHVPVNDLIGILLSPGEPLDEGGLPPAPAASPGSVPANPGQSTTDIASPAKSELRSLLSGAKKRRPAASPLARRLARSYGLDIGALAGTGPHGRVVRLDVERARPVGPAPAHVPAPAGRAPARAARGAPLHHVWLQQGEGRTVVLIHGFGSDLNSWRPFLSGTSLGRPVLGIDLPGHGGSRSHQERRFPEIVESVVCTLEALDLIHVDLVGHSLGGAVCAGVADDGRLDVGSLFLVAPAGLGPEINGAFLEGFTRARCAESLTPWLRELVEEQDLITSSFIRASLVGRDDEAAIEALQSLRRTLFPDGTPAFDIRRPLERLAVPVAVVFGRQDRIVPARQGAALPGEVGLHLFEGVGHMPQLEVRDALWRTLTRHLRAAQ